jgi:integrase
MSELTTRDFYQKHAQRRGLGFEKSAEGEEIYPVTEGLKSPYTKVAYRRNFNHFLDHIKIHDLQVLLEYNPKIVESFIIDYVRHLRDIEKLLHMSIRVHIAAIFHFLDMNDFDLSNGNKRKIKKFLPSDESTHDDRCYTTKEISRILSKCDERSKAIILLMTSTGMRIGAIHTLKIGDLEKISKYNLYKIQVYANSKKDRYYTFCTPECAAAIDSYLDYRKRFGEDVLKLKDKAPLIREQFNIDDKLRIQNPRFLSDETITHLVDDALKRSGVKTLEARRSHAFRKGFKSICEQSGMKSINVELLMGHNIGVSGHYYRPAESGILEDYVIHAVGPLTIDPTQRLERENAELRKDYLAELGDLREDFNEMKQLLVHLSKDSQKQLVNEFHQKVGDKADIEWSCDD